MARRASERTMELLDNVYELLSTSDIPIHYKQLADILVKSGIWVDPWGKEPDQILWSAINNHIKKYGTSGKFVWLGGGYVITTLIEGIEFYEEVTGIKATSIVVEITEEEKSEYLIKKCGECAFLSWSGPNITSHEVGDCSKYNINKRATIFYESHACPYWKQRSLAQFKSDKENAAAAKYEATYLLFNDGEHSPHYKRTH